jgi:hypothetical protein
MRICAVRRRFVDEAVVPVQGRCHASVVEVGYYALASRLRESDRSESDESGEGLSKVLKSLARRRSRALTVGRKAASFVSMVARFGLGERHLDDLVPNTILVEQNPMLDIFHLYRMGGVRGDQIQLPPPTTEDGGYSAGLRNGGKSQTVRIAWHPALPLPMWRCPACERSCYRLHWRDEQWRCRLCSGPLIYTSCSRNQTVPGWARAKWLRRRLGASPQLFTAIEPRPHNHRRYWRLARELREIEAGIARYLGVNICDVLEKRDARRSRPRRHRA